MASTNKTANLSLNQWVKSDPVLMEDMNEDNRKLDAMVNEIGRVKLFSAELKTSVVMMEFDFRGVDMSNIVQLEAYVLAPNYSGSLYLRINNLSTNDNYQAFYSNTWNGSEPGFPADACIVPIVFKFSTCYHRRSDGIFVRVDPPVAPTAITSVSLACNTSLPVGTRFVLTGVRI